MVWSMQILKRILAAIFGGVLFGILVPIAYSIFLDVPESPAGLIGIFSLGAFSGLILGFLFPRVFGFIFEIFLSI